MKPKKSIPAEKKEQPSTISLAIFKVIATDPFKAEARELKKKYPNIKDDFFELHKVLRKEPRTGDNLGGNLYKIRMAITDKAQGKSGGALELSYG